MQAKTIFISGSSKGIGKEIALYFAKKGYHVIINGKSDQNALEQTKKEIEKISSLPCLALLADLGDFEQAQKAFAKIFSLYPHLDLLVNNAGISYFGLLQDMSSKDWENILQQNLSSVFHCCKLSLPSMIERKKGKIIQISSVWGLYGASFEVAYSASKGGINAFTKALAKELAPSNIQVNALACGIIDTAMNAQFSEQEKKELQESIPLGRFGYGKEVAELVYLLAQSPAYLTGQILSLDGAWN
ncbi:3-ketoacyl-ACP reductase [Clostridia bacterium]|nr:3-ketoacyl-ACP reductase [Clostridia bacterium]